MRSDCQLARTGRCWELNPRALQKTVCLPQYSIYITRYLGKFLAVELPCKKQLFYLTGSRGAASHSLLLIPNLLVLTG